MANRDLLRALQSRLADRLQAAQTEGLAEAWLAVRAGAGRYLLPLAQSGEIFPLTSVQAVPYTQPWFLGVISLRGGLHGVVDLAAFLNEGPPMPPAPVPGSKPSVVTFSAALDLNCALRVDALLGLRHAEHFTSQTAPEPHGPAFLGPLYQDQEGQTWQEISLQALAQQPQFLRINA